MSDEVDQRNTILNLYNSGIDPETISLELDINQDAVMKVIKNETKKELEKSSNKNSKVLLNKLYLDAVIDIDKVIKESQVRIWKALKSKPDFNTSFKDTQNILERYGESKVNLVILHIDLVGSTRMSLNLPVDRLTTIIRSFAQQTSLIVSMYGGYVLKYIGDAVLAFFVVEDIQDSKVLDDINVKSKDDNKSYCLQFSNAISCAYTMIKVIQEGVNPILNQYDYPELKIRIGIDFGEIAVVQYGWDVDEYKEIVLKKPHLDLIGYTISIAVKMTTLAEPNHIVIGQKLYDNLDVKEKNTFRKLPSNPDIWNYMHKTTGRIYDLYGNTE
ncbi:MAG: adenylate/guanylate cyclase domain-containing protein [Candidatus Nitrosocosmicus sp.]